MLVEFDLQSGRASKICLPDHHLTAESRACIAASNSGSVFVTACSSGLYERMRASEARTRVAGERAPDA